MATPQAPYPIYLNLRGKPCIVVGGGEVASRKVALLMEAGAAVTVVSPEVGGAIRALVDEGKVKHIQENFREEHLEGYSLVIGATDSEEVNRAVAEGARRKGLWVNVVDSPGESDFFVPSVVRRGDLTIAISTGGKSPALARKVREELEGLVGQEYARLLDLLGRLRAEVFGSVKEEKTRASLYAELVDSDLLRLLKEGEGARARAELERILKRYGLPYKKGYLD